MTAVLLSSAVFAALLLSLTGAGADAVTWRKCWREDFDYGRVRVLEASPDSHADQMWLGHCNLTEVKSGDFDGLPNVDTIALSYNSIAHVDLAAFRTVPKLRWLELNDNNLREAPVFDEQSFCPSLTTLFLAKNRITEIQNPQTFAGCTKLQHLIIHHNVIEYIHPDIFTPLSDLTSLGLSDNKITAIPETSFIKNNQLDFLDLTYNKIAYLPSDFVSKLKSAGAPLQQFLFHNNPWHCACLLELLADVKRAGVYYTYLGGRGAYTGTEPACVYDGPCPCCRCRAARCGLLGRAGPRH